MGTEYVTVVDYTSCDVTTGVLLTCLSWGKGEVVTVVVRFF